MLSAVLTWFSTFSLRGLTLVCRVSEGGASHSAGKAAGLGDEQVCWAAIQLPVWQPDVFGLNSCILVEDKMKVSDAITE